MQYIEDVYDMGEDERLRLGELGRQHVNKNYNFDNFQSKWVDFLLDVYDKEGSWNTRTNYNGITFKEIA